MMNDKQTPTHADEAHETAEIICGDGYRLHGYFLPRAAGTSAGLPVLIAGAAGVAAGLILGSRRREAMT